MLKRLVLLLVLAFLGMGSSYAQNYVYTDATTLPVFGKVCDSTYESFSRLPASLEGSIRPAVWKLGRNSAGIYVRFRSDAGVYDFRWYSLFVTPSVNMTACTVRGLALYVFDEGEWVYVNTARPPKSGNEASYKIGCSKLKGSMHEYMVYLSLYDGVGKLEIGVPEGYSVEAPKLNSPRKEKAVVMYGTSILQGASSSHPGMCGTAQLSRILDRQVINLGFSGNALLDMEIARLMAAYPDPGVFVLDNTQNGTPELYLEKEADFYRILRAAHPDVPVVFVDHPNYPGIRFDEGRDRMIREKNQAFHKVFDDLVAAGEKNIYMVSSMEMLGQDNVGTVEGVHFTDIGFVSYANTLAPILAKLLLN